MNGVIVANDINDSENHDNYICIECVVVKQHKNLSYVLSMFHQLICIINNIVSM